MKPILPRTPFSTPFSSSRKQLEERVRNIVAEPQKHPPLPLLAARLTDPDRDAIVLELDGEGGLPLIQTED